MKTLVSALAVVSLAGSAFGATDLGVRGIGDITQTVDRINDLGDITQYVNIEATAIDSHEGGDRGTPVYSLMNVGTSAIPGFISFSSTPSSSIVGFNDYQTTIAPEAGSAFGAPATTGTVILDAMRWIGGVSVAGQQMTFFYLQNDFSTATAFTITFANAGNFIYTIPLLTVPGYVNAPIEGYFVAMFTGNAGVGRQFTIGEATATVGAQDPSNDFVLPAGAIPTYNGGLATRLTECFELQVPAPGAAALMGLAGLVGIRRRR